MAVTAGAVTTANLNTATTSTSFSFVSNGSPLYLVVPRWRAAQTLNTITFNTTGSFTRVAQSSPSNGDDAVEIWRILAPATTTANILLTFSGLQSAGVVGAFQISGQDTVTPEGTAATNTSSVAGTSTGNLAITGAAAGDLTIAGIADGGGTAITPAATGGGTVTEQWDGATSGEESEGFKVPDAVTQVSGTFASTSWAIAALPLKVLAVATPFIFQQNALWPHRAM